MKRPVLLIAGAAAGAFLLAAVGASAHSGLSPSKPIGVHSSTLGDEAMGASTAALEALPEATQTPEAPATTEPAEAADNDNNEDNDNDEDNDVEADDDNGAAAAAAATTKQESGDHETGDHQGDSKESSD